MIKYQIGGQFDLEKVIELSDASTLGERRPTKDRTRMKLMLEHANLIISAWENDVLVGFARSFTDFSYVTYM